MAYITFKHIGKTYPNGFEAVKDFNLEIERGEFVVLVGPSGCGKTTTLRMIAGLEDISTGTIEISGIVINDFEPKDRNIAMVFQNYALYPHMTVYDNMVYGLRFRKVSKEEIARRVKKTMDILGFDEYYLKRRPAQLSGGQKQRVALGRAIVREPGVFLMDEPLSNLDAKLRIQMRSEITKIHRSTKATTVYVTHDQTEAMTMADRIVVMNKGVIQQIASPDVIYDYPDNTFVAGFIGAPAMNFLKGIYHQGQVTFEDKQTITIPEKDQKFYTNCEDREIIFGVRPEDVHIRKDDIEHQAAEFSSKVDIVESLGYEAIHYLNDGINKIIAKIPHKSPYHQGDKIKVYFDMDKYAIFDAESTKRLPREK